MEVTRLNDVFEDWYVIGGGIFTALQEFDVPWKTDYIFDALDNIYHGNISGEKPISPLVNAIKTGEYLTDNDKRVLAVSILAVCGLNWQKQWDTLSLQYNPIENYRMSEIMLDDETVTEYGKTSTRTDNLTRTEISSDSADIDSNNTRTDNLSSSVTNEETITVDSTKTRTDNLSHTKTGTETVDIDETDTRTDNLTETTTPNLTTNTANTVHGFNSSVGVPTGEQTGTETGTNTLTKTGTQATVKDGTNETTFNTLEEETGTQTTTDISETESAVNITETNTGTQTNRNVSSEVRQYDLTASDRGTQGTVTGGSDTQTRNYELTRSGNIGVTTSQQMIQSERELWKWYYFYNIVFPDLDKVLTLPIY